jgi:cobalamin synthase
MGIGGGITLIVVGAILAFAVSDSVDAINLAMIGYICMAAGVLALIISLVLNAQRTNTTHREVIERHDDRRPPAPPAY